MTEAHWIGALVSTGGALLAALVALWGHHWLQNRLGRRIRNAEDVKARLYSFLALVAEYWMGESRDTVLEAKVVAAKLIVLAELNQMQHHSMRLHRWFRDTESSRLDMLDAATGGCFQQSAWAPDPSRVQTVTREMGRIMRTLREAC